MIYDCHFFSRRNNSIELRELMSKNQLKNVKLGQIDQIKVKSDQNALKQLEAKIWCEIEKRTQNNMDLQDKIRELDRHQHNLNVVETLNKQIEQKKCSKQSEKIEAEIERKMLEKSVNDSKILEKNRRIEKFQESHMWRKDLEVLKLFNFLNPTNYQSQIFLLIFFFSVI